MLRRALPRVLGALIAAGPLGATEVAVDCGGYSGPIALVERAATGERGREWRFPRCEAALPLTPEPGEGALLHLDAAGRWAEPIASSEARAGGSRLVVRPAVEVRGKARFARRIPLPAEAFLRIRDAAETAEWKGWRVPCPVEPETVSCSVPQGRWDLALRLPGHVTRFYFGVEAVPGKAVDLGRVEFTPGATLVGRVVVEGRTESGRPAVTLAPLSAADAGRVALGAVSTTAGGKGDFHFDGLRPGEYRVTAHLGALLSSRPTVVVPEGMEITMKEAVVLSRPVGLRVNLSPPRDPSGKPWTVVLIAHRNDREIEDMVEGAADPSGVWRKEGLRSGVAYRLQVRTAEGARWWSEEEPWVLGPEGGVKNVEPGFEEIRGRVLLGKTPLAAKLVFGGEFEGVSVPLRSGEEGAFEGVLPRLGRWTVTVDSAHPTVKRKLDVDVARDGGRGWVEIRLTNGNLQGRVVDEEGRLVPRALVTVQRKGSSGWDRKWIDGGAFEWEGLEPGSYVLGALAADREGGPVEAEVGDGGAPVQIVLRRQGSLRGRVVTEQGTGVVGAVIRRLAAPDFPGEALAANALSDAEGRFRIALRPGTPDVCLAVFPPGLGARMVRVAVTDDEVAIPVREDGGRLLLEYDKATDAALGLVYHAGCFTAPILFVSKVPGSTREALGDRWRLSTPGLEPGAYSLCMTERDQLPSWDRDRPPSARCDAGTLYPGGTLRLGVP